ncbi:MAG: sigma-54-dependent transcriptional regulator [bacterium]
MEKKRILVVDDEAIVRVSCERVLVPEGFSVRVISRGSEALDLLTREPYDLVITDLKMPDMDGLEILKNIKSRWPHITVILITGYGKASVAEQAVKQGAYEYLEKPFTPDDILRVVKKALEHQGTSDD